MFQAFQSQATPEEMWLAREVFNGWESCHLTPAAGSDEVPLAHAFQYAIGKSSTFINVPERLLDKTQAYVDALLEIEGRA